MSCRSGVGPYIHNMRQLILALVLGACGLDYAKGASALEEGMTRTTIVAGTYCKGADGLDFSVAGDIVIPCEKHGSDLELTPSAVVSWNNGDGTFTNQALPGNLVGPEEAKWYDEDNDGDEDIIITQATKISLYRRTGPRAFASAVTLWTRPVGNKERYNSVVPLSPGRFVIGSYSEGASIRECTNLTGAYTCPIVMELGSNGWPKRMMRDCDDVLVWNNAGPLAGVFYVFARDVTGQIIRLTTDVNTEGGSVKDGRIVTGTANHTTHVSTIQIIGEGPVTPPADFGDYRDAIFVDDTTLLITASHSTNLNSSVVLLTGTAFDIRIEVSGWEGIKHDNPGERGGKFFVTEELEGGPGLGLVSYQ